MKKILSLVLSCVMIFAVVPIANISAAASDSTSRQELISLLDYYNTELDYSSEDWYNPFPYKDYQPDNDYSKAKKNAEILLANEATTDEQFKKIIAELEAARYNLIKYELKFMLNSFKWDFYYATEYWYDYFTKDSYDDYLEAYERASAIRDDESSTLDDCKNAMDEFLTVQDNLIKKTPTEPTEPKEPKQELISLLEYYSTELDYTSEKWHPPYDPEESFSYSQDYKDYYKEYTDYYAAEQKAEELLADEKTTDEEYEAIIEELKKTKYAMIRFDLSAMDNYHDGWLWSFDYTPEAWYRKYTQESYDAYLAAHLEANILLMYRGEFATIEDFKKMIEKYQAAYESLVEVHLILGDVNSDGDINLADAILTQKSALSIIELSGNQMPCADVTEDNEVTIQDSIFVMKYSLNIPTEVERIGEGVRPYFVP